MARLAGRRATTMGIAMTTEGEPKTELKIELKPVSLSPGIARTFVEHFLLTHGFKDLVDDGCLIASELVTNAIAYAPLSVAWLRTTPNSGRPLLEIWDASPEIPVLKAEDLYDESGRGLLITSVVAAEWGYYPLSGGKVVWAILGRS
jgi:anti-sigma regulatory factor (Ser/Thr protein kinase)